VYPAHRLDRGTSGVLIFACSPEVAGLLGTAFAEDRVHKRYLALVRGRAPEQVLIDHPLAKEPGKPRQPAQTRAARLFSAPVRNELTDVERQYSWVEALPLTGRAHQVRRHLKHISHPIIGDVRYGKSEHNYLFQRRFGLTRMALHAERVSLVHPVSGVRLEVCAPLPEELQRVWSALSAVQAATSATSCT
jgi:tRNA pseudouridine65 synthase